jgi:Zn-dependent peptidase ImmA (M78 family)
MTWKAVQEARDKARKLIRAAKLKSYPVPVEALAKQQGIVVRSIPLDDELSGMSFVKDELPVIVVNSAHHPNRQRFTLAHELAHHVLHKDYLTNNVHVDKAILKRNQRSSEGVDTKEIEANAFAAEILMPKALLAEFAHIDINDDVELLDVARKFRVSPSAMAIRLANLD